MGVCDDIRLHAPHSYMGFNPARPDMFTTNVAHLERVRGYVQCYKPRSIVFHSGVEGDVAASISQLLGFREMFPDVFERALIENKPKFGVDGEDCIGASPAEVAQITRALGLGFCLDFAHASCFAAWARKDWAETVRAFMRLDPVMFHISDGEAGSIRDRHCHLGVGTFDLKAMCAFIPEGGSVVLETPHDRPDDLGDFCRDIAYLRKIMMQEKV